MGRFDTGAEEIFLRTSTSKRLKLDPTDYITTDIIFGNGSSIATSLAAQLNSHLQAIIIPDEYLVADLIAAGPIINLGYDIHLSRDQSYISEGDTKIMPIVRENNNFYVDIQRL